MRRHVSILWLLLLSIVLTPFGTLHAHVATDHHEAVLHGGHLHGLQGHSHDESPHDRQGQAVEVQLVGSGTGPDRGYVDLRSDWWPPLTAVSVLLTDAPSGGLLRRPPATITPPILHLYHWKPPLRGPPPRSIAS